MKLPTFTSFAIAALSFASFTKATVLPRAETVTLVIVDIQALTALMNPIDIPAKAVELTGSDYLDLAANIITLEKQMTKMIQTDTTKVTGSKVYNNFIDQQGIQTNLNYWTNALITLLNDLYAIPREISLTDEANLKVLLEKQQPIFDKYIATLTPLIPRNDPGKLATGVDAAYKKTITEFDR